MQKCQILVSLSLYTRAHGPLAPPMVRLSIKDLSALFKPLLHILSGHIELKETSHLIRKPLHWLKPITRTRASPGSGGPQGLSKITEIFYMDNKNKHYYQNK